jgi:hypothetical protein
MKLNLLFFIMDLLTILAYPFVFIYSKLLQFSKARESTRLATVLVTSLVIPSK